MIALVVPVPASAGPATEAELPTSAELPRWSCRHLRATASLRRRQVFPASAQLIWPRTATSRRSSSSPARRMSTATAPTAPSRWTAKACRTPRGSSSVARSLLGGSAATYVETSHPQYGFNGVVTDVRLPPGERRRVRLHHDSPDEQWVVGHRGLKARPDLLRASRLHRGRPELGHHRPGRATPQDRDAGQPCCAPSTSSACTHQDGRAAARSPPLHL